MTSPLQPHLQLDEGALFPCDNGTIIGREGSVAPERLAHQSMLSRRHLKIEHRAGNWIALLLPEARNRTWFDQAEMRPGIACRLTGSHEVQVSSYRFRLLMRMPSRPSAEAGFEDQPTKFLPASHLSPAPQGQPDTTPSPSQLFDTDPTAELTLDTLRGAPVGLIILDESFNTLWATEPLARFFNCAPEAIGCLLDQVPAAQRDDLRSSLENLRTSAEPRAIQLQLADQQKPVQPAPESHPGSHFKAAAKSPPTLSLNFIYQYPNYIGATADPPPERDHPSATGGDATPADPAEALARMGRTLAGFTLSRAFREGDLAKAMALLTVKSREAVDCSRVSVWLATERSPGKLICRASHGQSPGAAPGQIVNWKFCPDYFNRLRRTPHIASEREGSPLFAILSEIGFVDPASRSVLATGIQFGTNFLGVIAFERTGGDLKWAEPERHFALCAASFCLLTLQTREREDALKRLRETGELHEADLAEARKYFSRILPEPLQDHVVNVEWEFLPCESLGGDCFGYYWIDQDHFAAYVVDVVGHGSVAALLSVSVLNALRAGLIPNADVRDPAGVIAAINRSFQMEDQGMLTFTMWYGVFHRPSRRLTYSSAGHPPAILLLPDGPDGEPNYHELSTGGLIIGGMEDAPYDNASVDVGPHEAKLFIFTDGAFEIPLGRDRMWTFEEFVASLRSTQHMLEGETTYMLNRVRMLCDSDQLPDDFCMARILFKPSNQP